MKVFEQIISNIDKRIFKPIYFLYGDESYFVDAITNHIAKNVLSEAERSFNQTVFYGKDTDIVTVIETARRFPMMSSHQVVIVKEAQQIKNIKLLEAYMEQPLASTILVFAWKEKPVDSRLKVFKLIKEKGVLYKSPKVYDNQLGGWIQSYLKNKNVSIDPHAIMLLTENIGANLSRLSTELDKILVGIPKETNLITAEMIQENIGIHRDFNVFELQKALGQRNAIKAYTIADYFAHNSKNNPAIVAISRVFDYFVRLIKFHVIKDKSKNNVAAELGISIYFVDEYAAAARNYPPAKLMKIVHFLREADALLKGVDTSGIEERDLYKELIFKIIH
jgi:DNA polymerase-3 subunit delta